MIKATSLPKGSGKHGSMGVYMGERGGGVLFLGKAPRLSGGGTESVSISNSPHPPHTHPMMVCSRALAFKEPFPNLPSSPNSLEESYEEDGKSGPQTREGLRLTQPPSDRRGPRALISPQQGLHTDPRLASQSSGLPLIHTH